jgi:DNA modification methylase
MLGIAIKREVKVLKLKDIKPNPDNPRDIKGAALEGLRASIKKFGLIDLLVINKRNMEIVSGHQRYKVLVQEGVIEDLCVVVDVDAAEQQMMAASLNNQQIAGYWTAAIIPILEQLRRENPDDYLNLRLRELREEVNEFEIDMLGNTLPDDIPEPMKDVITRPGDLWILGEHRLLCGDSTKEADVARLMDGHKAQLFSTDPPYLVDYTGADRPGGGKDWSKLFKEKEIKDGRAFMLAFYHAGLKYVDINAALYIWHASSRIMLLRDVFAELNVLVHQQIIWVKPCSILTFSLYMWRHEPCLLCWQKGSRPYYRPSQKGASSVWKIDLLRNGDPTKPEYYNDIWELDYDGKKRNVGAEHPTIKPTECFAIPMRMHTRPGDICYEPFSGSGSQIIAGERLNRRVFAIELEPVFCDVAVRRWEDFTGKKARRE